MAVARTKVAVDATVCFGLPPESFVERGCILEDLKGRHNPRTSKAIIRLEEIAVGSQ
jgi:hypothetical protein